MDDAAWATRQDGHGLICHASHMLRLHRMQHQHRAGANRPASAPHLLPLALILLPRLLHPGRP